MAARVVYLVATGQVRPDEVLGPDLHHQGRHRAAPRDPRGARASPGSLASPATATRRGGDADEDAEVLEPTVATYNAYAATLLTDHGLRIGHEPDTRVITDAARYQLGARVVDRHTGAVEHLTDHPPTAIQNLLALDSAMTRAPRRRPTTCGAFDAEARRGFERALAAEVAGKDRKTYREAVREGGLRDRPARRAARPGRGLPRAQARPGADGLLRPDRARPPGWPRRSPRSARWSARGSRWCCSTSTRTPPSPRR